MLCLAGLLAACQTAPEPEMLPQRKITAEEAIQVFFLGPGTESSLVLQKVIESMDSAVSSIDVAVYNLSLEAVEQALIRAHKRGVTVRVAVESEGLNSTAAALKKAGIRVVDDRANSLMHNKFIIIDNSQVWTGSANLTGSSFSNDRNNLLHFSSQDLAAQYTREMDAMYQDYLFGVKRTAPLDDQTDFQIGDYAVELYFSPEDNPRQAILDELRAARQEIKFLTYSFTDNPLADVLMERSQSGVLVEGVFDADMRQSNTGTEYPWLASHHIAVCLDGDAGLMHHKVFIIDGQTVITGSANYTRSAFFKNDENLLIIHNPSLARQYLDEYEFIKKTCRP